VLPLRGRRHRIANPPASARFGLVSVPVSPRPAGFRKLSVAIFPCSQLLSPVDKLPACFVARGKGRNVGNKSRSRIRGCCAAIAFCAAIVPVVAHAQDAAIDRIEAIERKIRGLESELQHLKSELGEAKQQLRQSRSEAQRAHEELREAREAAERARQDALKAATAEAQATQAATPTLPSPAGGGGLGRGPPQAQVVAAANDGVKVSMPEGRPTIATADGRLSLAIGGLMQFDMGGYFQNPNPNTQFPQLNDGVNLRRGRLYFVGKFDDFTVNIEPNFGGSPDGTPTLSEASVNYTGSSR
jgi:phosphate-selective porin OprO/OprP